MRWAGYAACAWGVLFGVIHLYWALGGKAGFVQFSLPPNQALVLTRDPTYIAITWGVVIMSVLGAVVALAAIQPWGRIIPRWLLLTTLWTACGMLLVRGIGNPIQTALIKRGLITFAPVSGPLAQAWNQWLTLDLVLFSPWFCLGGFAFGATAWFARRRGDYAGGRDVVGEGRL